MRLALAAALAGHAAGAECAMSYPDFEYAVPHVDLESCPEGVAREPAFCRLAAGQDQLHVFVFAEADEQCLLAVRRYGEEAFTIELKE